MSFTINVKMSGAGETFSIEVQPTSTIKEMKGLCVAAKSDLEADRITLVFKGRILKDDQTCEDVKLAEGQTMHLVNKPSKKATPKPASTATPAAATTAPAAGAAGAAAGAAGAAGANPFAAMGGMGGMAGMPGMGAGMGGMGGMDPSQLGSMMQNPMVQQMMQNMMSNPDTLNQMIEGNPMLS